MLQRDPVIGCPQYFYELTYCSTMFTVNTGEKACVSRRGREKKETFWKMPNYQVLVNKVCLRGNYLARAHLAGVLLEPNWTGVGKYPIPASFRLPFERRDIYLTLDKSKHPILPKDRKKKYLWSSQSSGTGLIKYRSNHRTTERFPSAPQLNTTLIKAHL